MPAERLEHGLQEVAEEIVGQAAGADGDVAIVRAEDEGDEWEKADGRGGDEWAGMNVVGDGVQAG